MVISGKIWNKKRLILIAIITIINYQAIRIYAD